VPAPWTGLEGLLDRATDVEAVRTHRLQTAAARRWRAAGRHVPEDFVQLERWAAGTLLAAPETLTRVRRVVDGPILLHKGPEAAAAYPDPVMRGFDDIDLIVRDAPAVQRALVRAGFVEIGDPARYRDIHHLRPLEWPGLPLRVEIHSRPKWPQRLTPPAFDELVESSRPAAIGVEGILAPSPVHHALLLAAHAWAHVPLRRLRDLLDVAAVAAPLHPAETAEQARRWQLSRVWATTVGAAACVFGDGPRTMPLRIWGRHLVATRERTVLESHLQRLLSHFWELPPGPATRAAGRRLVEELLPAEDEEWEEKLQRTRFAFRNAMRSRLDHDRALGPLAQRPARHASRGGEEPTENLGKTHTP